ncbi:hypothetical protein I316_04784, partial [Kwoniella heveanensis BCC8398]
GKHVVFGEVASDASFKVVKEIEARGNKDGKPLKDKIVVVQCGAV